MAELARRRFQVHLSTALVMMVVAGGIVWANTRPVHFMNDDFPKRDTIAYGWPCDALRFLPIGKDLTWILNEVHPGLGVDVLVALGILFAVWFVCEWWIRRRDARREEKPI